jgi:hypothetical protein
MKTAVDLFIPSKGSPQMLLQGGSIFVNDVFLSKAIALFPDTSLKIPYGFRIATDKTGKGLVYFTKHKNFPSLTGDTYEVTYHPEYPMSWTKAIRDRIEFEVVKPSEIPMKRERLAHSLEDIITSPVAPEVTKEAKTANGLYGYTKGIEKLCCSASGRLSKYAAKIMREAVAKDPNIVPFLQTHAKRGKSASAKILLASYRDSLPKLAAQKEAGVRTYGMYGYPAKTTQKALLACSAIREEAGYIAADLHQKRADMYDKITGFLGEHSKTAKDTAARIILDVYPEADFKFSRVASTQPQTVEEWLAWEPDSL